MGVVLVFEPASDAHWMKDVVQFPNALAQMINGRNATLIARPNHKQKELEKHIQLVYLDEPIPDNYSNFENSDFSFSKLITNSDWYINGCSKAADIGENLILYPWYGDPFKGAKIFKIKRWLRFKKAFVILKSDGFLKEKSQYKTGLKEKIKDYFKYFYFDKIICENLSVYNELRNNNTHLSNKLTFIPNCPLDIYHSSNITPYNERSRNFLFVGRISDFEKGADLLLDTWLKIFNSVSDWNLQLVGPCDNNFRNIWQLKLLEANAANSVKWYPTASPKELLNYYNNARVVLCSSRKESGPIVLSEAVLSGCAFIGTAVGEIPDLLRNMPGLVNDIEKLGDEIMSFALDDNLAMEQAIQLRKKISDRNWSEQVKKILE